MLWTGASIAYWSGLLTPINAKFLKDSNPNYQEDYILQNCLQVLAFFGIGSTCSAIMMGKIIDHSNNSRKPIFINILVQAALITANIVNIREGNFGVLSYVLCFLWGLQDGIVNTHCFQMLGYEFDTYGDQYSVFQFVQGISVSIFQFTESELDIDSDDSNRSILNYTYFISVFGLVCIAYTFTFDFKKVVRKPEEEKGESKEADDNESESDVSREENKLSKI